LILLAFAQGLGVTALNATIVNLLPRQRTTVMASNSAMLYLGLTISAGVGGWLYPLIGFNGIIVAAMVALGVAIGLTRELQRRL